MPADLESAQRLAQRCDGALDQARQRFAHCEAEWSSASSAVQEMDLGDATNMARLDQASVALREVHTALADARARSSDDALARTLADARRELGRCAGDVAEAESLLAAEDPDSVEELLRNARAVKSRLADERHDVELKARDVATKLAVRGEEGLAGALDAAKSELVHLSVHYERLEQRALGAKMLYDTFARRRDEAHLRYVAPFREQIERFGRLVFDPTFEVALDADLRIATRTVAGVTLPFADLSTGAKEQLGLISRLACASIVSSDGGAPVIFDDALGWSDPDKLSRMGAVISLAGRSCQIIVLTCTPGRYAGVGNARVVALER